MINLAKYDSNLIITPNIMVAINYEGTHGYSDRLSSGGLIFPTFIPQYLRIQPWVKVSRNSIGSLFWPPQIRLLTMLWLFEKYTILTP